MPLHVASSTHLCVSGLGHWQQQVLTDCHSICTLTCSPPPLAIVGVNSKVLAAVAVLSLIEFAYGLLCSIRLTASHSLTLSSSPLSHDKFVVVL